MFNQVKDAFSNPNSMVCFQFKGLDIEISNDPTYSFNPPDNNQSYLKQYFGEEAKDYPVSKYGIRIFEGGKELNSCIVIGSGGDTSVSKNSILIDNDKLILCCCDTIFCLTLPELILNWKIKADEITCFQVFQIYGDYLVHGEVEISRIDNEGRIKWQFSGADIFVNIDGQEEFIMETDHIELTDFCGTQYKIDFNGNSL